MTEVIGFLLGFLAGAVFGIGAAILVLVPEFGTKFGGRDA